MVPIGGIIQWSGAIIDIPDAYQICDGTNGTPDLRNKFVAGAGDTYAVDETGGALTHQHAVGATDTTVTAVGEQFWVGGVDSDFASSLPPFLALAYIQRMS